MSLIVYLRQVFDEAEEAGFQPYLLDIGGGFLGAGTNLLLEEAACINTALTRYFPDQERVKVWAMSTSY